MTKIEALRRAKGMSQRDVERAIGISATTISHVERRRREAYPKIRKVLSELYGVPEDVLFDANTGMAKEIDEETLRRLAG